MHRAPHAVHSLIGSWLLTRGLPCAAEAESSSATTTTAPAADISKELNKFTRQTASTFAPRPSTATKNPAFKGSLLYDIFEWQAWISLVLGGGHAGTGVGMLWRAAGADNPAMYGPCAFVKTSVLNVACNAAHRASFIQRASANRRAQHTQAARVSSQYAKA